MKGIFCVGSSSWLSVCFYYLYDSISTSFTVSNLQSAIFALSGSAVPKPLLRDVNCPIVGLLLDD